MFGLFITMAFFIAVLAICLFNALGYNQKLVQSNHELTVRLNTAQRTISEIDYQRRIGAKVPTLYEVV